MSRGAVLDSVDELIRGLEYFSPTSEGERFVQLVNNVPFAQSLYLRLLYEKSTAQLPNRWTQSKVFFTAL